MRRSVGLLLIAVILLVGLALLGTGLPRSGDRSALTLAEVGGAVSITRRGDALPAEPGRALEGDERITTGEDGRAVLALGADTRIRVGESATVEVVSVGRDGVDLELEGGSVQATVRPSSRAVRVSARGRQVQATDADFAVALDGDALLIESRRGDLMAQGLPGVGVLAEGSRVVVEGERAPEVLPIPDDLLLDVDWPTERRTRAAVAEVRGRTAPGATIRVQGAREQVRTRADAQGEFLALLPLTEGDNPVQVRAIDLFGEEIAVEVVLVRDTQGPVFRGGVQ